MSRAGRLLEATYRSDLGEPSEFFIVHVESLIWEYLRAHPDTRIAPGQRLQWIADAMDNIDLRQYREMLVEVRSRLAQSDQRALEGSIVLYFRSHDRAVAAARDLLVAQKLLLQDPRAYPGGIIREELAFFVHECHGTRDAFQMTARTGVFITVDSNVIHVGNTLQLADINTRVIYRIVSR